TAHRGEQTERIPVAERLREPATGQTLETETLWKEPRGEGICGDERDPPECSSEEQGHVPAPPDDKEGEKNAHIDKRALGLQNALSHVCRPDGRGRSPDSECENRCEGAPLEATQNQ